jgi:hypothetical protein
MGYVVLLMSEDKVITRITPDNARSKLDPYVFQDRLGSPYLVLLPPSTLSSNYHDILISSSSLYPSLCHLSDLLRLFSNSTTSNLPFMRRYTYLPVSMSVSSLPPPSQRFLRDLSLTHSLNTPIESDLIDCVLNSAREARLRDLPAYLLASQKLQSKINKLSLVPSQ